PDQHASDLAVLAGRRLLDRADLDPGLVDAVVYFGSTWKDYPVWQAAPKVAFELGCHRAFALELDYVSCGAPVALRVARDMMVAEEDLSRVLLVAGSRESGLLDYGNQRSRFMFDFGDGAAAALVVRGHPANAVLGSHMVTDGSFWHQVMVPAGGSVAPASPATVAAGAHHIDVSDPVSMKKGLDEVSLDNFVVAARGAAKRSGHGLEDIALVCLIHLKTSMREALMDALGVDPSASVSLEDTGHMSGVDPLFALDRAARAGRLAGGDLVLLLAAGTGYTWAATLVRWGL
ncbi:MAG: 3-oxoacyl-ACP synthase, partial [Acidimicrobiales bacterium]